MISSKLNNLLDKVYRQFSENTVKSLFYAITLIGLVVLTVVSVIIYGISSDAIFFSDKEHYFMDYFYSIFYSLNGPYMNHNVIYPPLITVVYEAIGIALEWNYSTFANGFEIRDSFFGMTSYIISVIIAAVAIFFILQKSKRISKGEALMFFLVIITSYPMIFCIDRGNSIIFSVIFVALFLIFYNSDNRNMRYLAYISLGIATSIKIYPVLFGLLVLKEGLDKRDLKETLICVIIGALIFFTPFLLTDGTFIDMFHNATSYSGNAITFGHVNIVSILEGILMGLGIENYASYRIIGHLISYSILLLIAVAVLFDKKMPTWQTICLLAGSQILCAGLGVEYLLLYMAIPAWYFINSDLYKTREYIVYGVLLAVILLSVPGGAGIGNILNFVKGLATLSIVIIILVKSYGRMFDMYRTRKGILKIRSIDEPDDC